MTGRLSKAPELPIEAAPKVLRKVGCSVQKQGRGLSALRLSHLPAFRAGEGWGLSRFSWCVGWSGNGEAFSRQVA